MCETSSGKIASKDPENIALEIWRESQMGGEVKLMETPDALCDTFELAQGPRVCSSVVREMLCAELQQNAAPLSRFRMDLTQTRSNKAPIRGRNVILRIPR